MPLSWTDIINGFFILIGVLAGLGSLTYCGMQTEENSAEARLACIEKGGIYADNRCQWSLTSVDKVRP